MMHKGWLIAAWLVTLVASGATIARHEHTLRSGQHIYLALAPVDPRSLMQGDFMALRFELAQAIDQALYAQEPKAPTRDGVAIIALDERRIARVIAAIGQPQAGQLRLRYQRPGAAPGMRSVQISTDAYFFQEGQAERYARARYGEFAVADDGTALLVGLRDEQLAPL